MQNIDLCLIMNKKKQKNFGKKVFLHETKGHKFSNCWSKFFQKKTAINKKVRVELMNSNFM